MWAFSFEVWDNKLLLTYYKSLINRCNTPQARKVAGLSRPDVSDLRLIEKHQEQLLQGKKKKISHYRPIYQGTKKKNQKKNILGVRTHVCKIFGFQTQATKKLGHQNCNRPPVVASFLAWFTGKTGELRNGVLLSL